MFGHPLGGAGGGDDTVLVLVFVAVVVPVPVPAGAGFGGCGVPARGLLTVPGRLIVVLAPGAGEPAGRVVGAGVVRIVLAACALPPRSTPGATARPASTASASGATAPNLCDLPDILKMRRPSLFTLNAPNQSR